MRRSVRIGTVSRPKSGRERNSPGLTRSVGLLNDERRCLVIDGQPTIRLGVRGLLADRYEVEEAENGRDALELLTLIGDFDVAIVELPGGHRRPTEA